MGVAGESSGGRTGVALGAGPGEPNAVRAFKEMNEETPSLSLSPVFFKMTSQTKDSPGVPLWLPALAGLLSEGWSF